MQGVSDVSSPTNPFPPFFRPQDREAYSLAAGLALGLIHLSKGTQALGHAELDLDTRLWCACMLACVGWSWGVSVCP